jgi:hypothetical protein
VNSSAPLPCHRRPTHNLDEVPPHAARRRARREVQAVADGWECVRAADGEEGGGQKASRQVYCTGFRVATEAQIREFFSPAGGVVAMCNKVWGLSGVQPSGFSSLLHICAGWCTRDIRAQPDHSDNSITPIRCSLLLIFHSILVVSLECTSLLVRNLPHLALAAGLRVRAGG